MTKGIFKGLPTQELLWRYKKSAKSVYLQRETDLLYAELMLRLTSQQLRPIQVGLINLKIGKGVDEFNKACDELILKLDNDNIIDQVMGKQDDIKP